MQWNTREQWRASVLMTIPQVVQALRLSRTKVYDLINSGQLPVIRIGRSVRVRSTDLERWVESLESSQSVQELSDER
jgi:excisionase family DNA binding protein